MEFSPDQRFSRGKFSEGMRRTFAGPGREGNHGRARVSSRRMRSAALVWQASFSNSNEEGCREFLRQPSPKRMVMQGLDVQVLNVQRILFDELAARIHVLAHQCGEDLLRSRQILKSHRKQ